MKECCALGIDVGTSAVRIIAIDAEAAIQGAATSDIERASEGQGHTQSPLAWWQAASRALLAIGQHVALGNIKALSIDATSGTVLGVDEDGIPQTPGRMYNDRASPTTVDALAKILPENSAARGASSPLARIIDMQNPRIEKFLHQADWLAGKFSGRFDLTDENNALKSGFDAVAGAWPDWVAAAGVNPKLLPRVVPTGTDLGAILPGVSAQFGIGASCRVVSGTTDGCASFVASGARTVGDAVTSLGTTLTVKQVSNKPIAAARFGVYSHHLEGLWLCGGASNSGGAALLEFFTPPQLVALESRLQPETPTGLDYYPLLAVGERFPYADPLLEPRVLPRPDDDACFLQGLLEGIAAIEKVAYQRMQELGAPAVRRVFTVGGGSRNEAWRLIRERTLGVPVVRGIADAAYGSALIALSVVKRTSIMSSN